MSAVKSAEGRARPSLSHVVTAAHQAMSIKFNARVYELRRRGIDVLVMSLGEAHFDLPRPSLEGLPYPDLYHYSDSRGLPELRALLAGYFHERYDVRFDPQTEIVITAGSKAAIHMTLMSILDPGDEVLIPDPSWVSYPEQVKLCYGVPRTIPHDRGIEDYGAYVNEKTRALILTNPHNPRGYVYTEAEIRALLDLARKHDLWLLSDEAYSEFVLDDAFCSVGRVDPDKQHGVVFNSVSKNYGISGWRLGYVIGRKDLLDGVLKVNQHLITCAPTVLEHYVAQYFTQILEITRPQIADVVRLRQRMARYLDEIGLAHLPGSATFYLFVSIAPSRLDSESFCERLLEEEHVCVVPGIGYGPSCDAFVRVSVGAAPEEELRRGVDAIQGLIERTS